MRHLLSTPIEQVFAGFWSSFDGAYKKGFFAALCVSILAFGFEMNNLTLHHDDVVQIFIQDTILGHYLGRFGVGWLHYYTQNAHFMPFLQMFQGIVFMSAYGVLVAHFWGMRRTLDVAMISAILSVFPYMAQVYQYNTSMATYSLAHLLAALAVILSARGTAIHATVAALLYVAAFSIYQAVIANAATIFVFWMLAKLLFREEGEVFLSKSTIRSTMAVMVSVVAGGALYLICVSFIDIEFDSYQSAEKAFSPGAGMNLAYAIPEILKGTRSFFFWPESYFPNYLKKLQLIFVAGAAIACLWLPKGVLHKSASIALLVLAGFTPRVLQLMHAEGHYHALTLTGYAVVIAGAVAIIVRAAPAMVRNASAVLAFFLIAGYVIQCNWISTVNYLNTLAHFQTLTQILARVRSLPDTQWDGKTIAVVGRYDMPSAYPFKGATGVATEFMDAGHMGNLARLMRDDVTFVKADEKIPKVLEYAVTRQPWPHSSSVGVVDGIGVVVLSKE